MADEVEEVIDLTAEDGDGEPIEEAIKEDVVEMEGIGEDEDADEVMMDASTPHDAASASSAARQAASGGSGAASGGAASSGSRSDRPRRGCRKDVSYLGADESDDEQAAARRRSKRQRGATAAPVPAADGATFVAPAAGKAPAGGKAAAGSKPAGKAPAA